MGTFTEPGFGDDMVNASNLRHNFGVTNFVKISGSLLAGLVTGMLGVTGWIGFSYYFVTHLLVSVLLWHKAGGQINTYFPTASPLLFGEIFGSTSLLTFILFWTLAHNVIHLF